LSSRPIDPVDRPKLGHHNLLGIVLDVKENLYKVGTSNGVLPQRFARNQLEPCENDFLSLEDVPSNETTFRAAVGADSVTGTQGNFLHNKLNEIIL
jgi:hypothetical protein